MVRRIYRIPRDPGIIDRVILATDKWLILRFPNSGIVYMFDGLWTFASNSLANNIDSGVVPNHNLTKCRPYLLPPCVALLFIICHDMGWVLLVLKSVNIFVPDTHFKISLQIVSHVLAYTSSCINPLLYAFLSENFRKAFRKIVYCGPGSRRQGSQRHMPLPTKTTRTGSCPDIL